jgi:hypothetical protein
LHALCDALEARLDLNPTPTCIQEVGASFEATIKTFQDYLVANAG